MLKTKTVRLFLALLLACAVCAPARAATRGEVLNRLEEFRRFFVDFQYAPDKAIPGDLLADCYGVIIMRQYKAGFVFGAKGGDGVILMHDRGTGEWSPPAFVRMAEGSFGFQIGGQAIDAIILIMNQAGVDMLLKTRFKIGVDASAAAGPVGRDVSASVGPGTALLTYSRAMGLYAGASFEGGGMLNNNGYNRGLYGMDVGLREILFDRRVQVPREAYSMAQTLKSYAVRNTAPITPVTPAPAPIVGRPAPRPVYDDAAAYRDENYRTDVYRANAGYPEAGYQDTGGYYETLPPAYPEYGQQIGQSQMDLEDEARRAAIAAENAARLAREAAEEAERAAQRATGTSGGW